MEAQASAHTYPPRFICVYLHIFADVYTYTHICVCLYTYIYVYTHIICVTCLINVPIKRLFWFECQWLVFHKMSCVRHVNESCHTCGWVMSHSWMSQDALVEELCHTHEWESLLMRITMSGVTQNESCQTYKWVMTHMWMSHATHMNES